MFDSGIKVPLSLLFKALSQLDPKNVTLFPRVKLGSLLALKIVIFVPLSEERLFINVMPEKSQSKNLISPFTRESLIVMKVLKVQ